MKRRETKTVYIDNIPIGSGHPIVIQSMTNTDTKDVVKTMEQIHRLKEAGCEIIRVAVPTQEVAKKYLPAIVAKSPLPIVADIHFDYKIALLAIEAGVAKLRINPGNLKNKEQIYAVVQAAKAKKIPIRVGVNGGSLPAHLREKYDRKLCLEMFVEACLEQVMLLESLEFYDIIISIKASSVRLSIDALQALSKHVNYPFHIGVTEAGGGVKGMIKSSVGIGSLLTQGLGDTVRVSLTDDPVKEIETAKNILQATGLRLFGPELVSCPSCGRTEIGLIKLAKEVEAYLEGIRAPITVAVMGCVVNGPGEAREADIGIAGGKDCGILFKKGKIIEKLPESALLKTLLDEIAHIEKDFLSKTDT